MTRSGGRRAVGALAVCLCALALVPASAAGVLNVMLAYNELPPGLKPAALVPMSFPPAFGPIGEIEVEPQPEGRGRYGLLFSHVIPAKHPGAFPRTAANLLVRSFGRTPLAKEARIAKSLYHVSPAIVRGHKAVVIKGKHQPTVGLIWSEGGGLYGLASGTPKTIPLAELQRTAAGLDRIAGQLQGETPTATGYTAKGLGIEAHVMLGEHAALVETSWQSECHGPAATEGGHPGGAKTTLAVPLGGGSVAFGPAPVTAEGLIEGETAAWMLSVAGTLAAAGGQLTENAAGTSDGAPCAIGPATFPLAPLHER